MNIIQNLKTTNELLLFIINKHNISLGALLNDDGACIQDVIDNNNFLIDSGGWISVDDGLPDDDKDDYLVYSIHTKVYEKVDIEKLKMMIDNSAKITHWQPSPLPPRE